jgi:hypothetical protein
MVSTKESFRSSSRSLSQLNFVKESNVKKKRFSKIFEGKIFLNQQTERGLLLKYLKSRFSKI